VTEYTWEDFGPGESGPQFELLAERLVVHGCGPRHALETLKDQVQRFQLAQGFKGTQLGGGADGWVGPETWRRLQLDPKPTTPPPPAPSLPAQILNLLRWKLTTPLGPKGDPTEVRPPGLLRFADARCFFVRGQAVVFRTWGGGTTTENSTYTRSELRELDDDGDEIAWDNGDGKTRTLTGECAVTALPEDDPEVVVAQIHDDVDDVLMIRVVGDPDDPAADLEVFAEWSKGKGKGSTKELLGTVGRGETFGYEITADAAGIRVQAFGTTRKRDGLVRDDLYFKAGCYMQAADGIAEVEYTELDLQEAA
jgi:hypothetical protein